MLTYDSLIRIVFQFKFDGLKSLQLVLLYCSGCEHFNHERTICSSEPYTETHIFWRACYGLDFNTNVDFRKNNTDIKQQILFCFSAQDANIFIINIQFVPTNHIRSYISSGELVMGLALTQMLIFGKTTLKYNKELIVLIILEQKVIYFTSKPTMSF